MACHSCRNSELLCSWQCLNILLMFMPPRYLLVFPVYICKRTVAFLPELEGAVLIGSVFLRYVVNELVLLTNQFCVLGQPT